MPNLSSPTAVLVGCAVGVVSSMAQSVGLTLQRKSHVLETARPASRQRPPYRRAMWRFGVLLFILANVFGSSIQISTLPLVILSPLQAVGLMFNSICSALLLGEPFTLLSSIGTVLVVVGAFLIAFFGTVPEPTHSLADLLQLLGRRVFLLWFSATLQFVVLLVIVAHFISHICSSDGALRPAIRRRLRLRIPWSSDLPATPTTPAPHCPPTPLCPTSPHSKLPQTPHTPHTPHSHPFHPTEPQNSAARRSITQGVLYGVVSGVLSAHSLLMAKSAVEIIVRVLLPDSSELSNPSSRYSDLLQWQSYLIVSLFLLLAVLQLFFLNKGLKLCSTSVLYPLVFCVYNVTNIVNSLVYFDQLASLSAGQVAFVVFGTLLVLAGVLALSWRLGAPEAPPDAEAVPLTTDRRRGSAASPAMEFGFRYGATKDDPGSQYVSFGSPTAAGLAGAHDRSLTGLLAEAAEESGPGNEEAEFREEAVVGPRKLRIEIPEISGSPPLPVETGTRGKRSTEHPTSASSMAPAWNRSRRTLSYEQAEILSQLRNLG